MKNEQFIEHVISSITNYFRAVEYVNQNPKLPKEEKLERLLAPLINLNKLLLPLHSLKENPYRLSDGTYPFTSERVYKEDLDLDHLQYDENRYFLDWLEDERIPERRGPRIWIFETEEKRSRERRRREEEIRRGHELEDATIPPCYPGDLYPAWLPTLDEEKIQSRDLLDQILVCYTIKRAMNGDKEAIDKLYNLYSSAAKSHGRRFGRKHRLPVNELEDTANALLLYIIQGFSPEVIIKDLLVGQQKTILYLPGWVKDFFIYYLSEYLPSRIEETLGKMKSLKESEQKDGFVFVYFNLLALMNPYTPIRDFTLWEKSEKRIKRFNTYCFRPGVVRMGPHTNLTTWIFAKHCGRLYQLLMDKYEREIFVRENGKRVRIKIMNDDVQDRFIEESKEESQSELSIEERKLIVRDKEKPLKKKLNETIAEVKKHGASQRDAEIFTVWKFRQSMQEEIAEKFNLSSRSIITQKEIAEKFNLSRRQIIRICNKIAKMFDTPA